MSIRTRYVWINLIIVLGMLFTAITPALAAPATNGAASPIWRR